MYMSFNYTEMFITSSWLADLLILFATITFFTYKYATRKFQYWEKKKVCYVNPIPFFGNTLEVITFKTNLALWLKNLYDSTTEPYFGIFIFDEPYLVLRSPELIKQVLVKDFNYFTDRTIVAPKHDEIISNMMLIQKSPAWKVVRPKMTPVFTSGKLKGMFSLIDNVAGEMNQYISKNLGKLEAKELSAKYSTDVIAKCAFAINAHSFDKEDATFRKISRSVFDFRWRNAITQVAYFFMENLVQLFRLNFIEKWARDFLAETFWKAIKARENSNVKGNDLIDIIVNMRKNKDLCKEINFYGDKVVAQSLQFFLAGFETTSTTISFTLYELCIHPRIQNKLRSEILNTIKEHGGFNYDAVPKMKYLDMCVKETLRKYPVLPFLDRRCNEDYKIPDTDVTIEKGMAVYIPLYGLHYDKKYFPIPESYNPERFSENNSHNVNGLYYLPFGDGPRSCIGERFGLMSTKVALVYILSEFEVERTLETPVPMEFSPRSFMLLSKVGLPMKFRKVGAVPA